ncbi:MAG: creatininase family protein [Candidatus Nitrosocaldus sp.]
MNVTYARDGEVRDTIKKNTRIKAILPIGSLEQHGKHLPLATDSIIAEHIASIIAERLNALLLPAIGYGISYEHEPLFNVSISASTLCMIIEDICRSLAENGVKRLIILNGHYGNEHALLSCVKELAKKYMDRGILISSITYSLFLEEPDHAGENETSLMLAIRPDLVNMDTVGVVDELKYEGHRYKGEQSRLDSISTSRITLLPGSISEIASDGVIGNPKMASKDRGYSLLEEISANIIKVIEEVEHMYEQMNSSSRSSSNNNNNRSKVQDDLYMQSTEDER